MLFHSNCSPRGDLFLCHLWIGITRSSFVQLENSSRVKIEPGFRQSPPFSLLPVCEMVVDLCPAISSRQLCLPCRSFLPFVRGLFFIGLFIGSHFTAALMLPLDTYPLTTSRMQNQLRCLYAKLHSPSQPVCCIYDCMTLSLTVAIPSFQVITRALLLTTFS